MVELPALACMAIDDWDKVIRPEAYHYLAQIHRDGCVDANIAPDTAMAMHYLRVSALGGRADSQFELAQLYASTCAYLILRFFLRDELLNVD